MVDGRLTKISEDMDFVYDRRDFMRPWTIGSRTGRRVRLRFEPEVEKRVRVPLGLASADLHLCFGRFDGEVDGHAVEGLPGWAEEMRARW